MAIILVVASLALVPPVSAQTAADIESRDTLNSNQEALLKVCRCTFDMDPDEVVAMCADVEDSSSEWLTSLGYCGHPAEQKRSSSG